MTQKKFQEHSIVLERNIQNGGQDIEQRVKKKKQLYKVDDFLQKVLRIEIGVQDVTHSLQKPNKKCWITNVTKLLNLWEV